MNKITVFTCCFNREKLLARAYEALKRQTCKDFIWMIIDDGSTDNTRAVVESWINKTREFSIEYYYKENGGLHTAYNEAIAHINTELCVAVDSDDFLPNDAIEKILKFWKQNGSNKYAGIVGLDSYLDGRIIGDVLPEQESINLIDLLAGKYHIQNGDRTLVVRTELYKEFAPMKVFPDEKNFNPHYLHLQISYKYNFLVLNESLKYVEYQPTGMSNSMLKQYWNSPNSFAETRKLYLSFPNTSWKFRMRHSIHFVSSCILAGKFGSVLKESPCPAITFLAIPFGWILSLYIRTRGK